MEYNLYTTWTFEVLSNDFKSGKYDYSTFLKEIIELQKFLDTEFKKYNECFCEGKCSFKDFIDNWDFEKNYEYASRIIKEETERKKD